jgi:hypothetical protein
MQSNTVKEHNYLIDCFRILAVLMVLSVHIRDDLDNVPSIIYKLFGLGAYGVALYFIISGFLSYRSVVKCKSFETYVHKKNNPHTANVLCVANSYIYNWRINFENISD